MWLSIASSRAAASFIAASALEASGKWPSKSFGASN